MLPYTAFTGLCALSLTSAAFIGAPAGSGRRCSRAVSPVCQIDQTAMLQKLSSTFWESKRAMLQADLDTKLAELAEFQAREEALYDTVSTSAIAPSASGDAAMLTAELELEKQRTAALEAELAAVRLNNERALQQVAAFWVQKVAEARGQPALEAAAPAAPAAPAGADIMPPDKSQLLEADLSLRELRSRLLGYGLSTLGLKTELRARLEKAMLDERQKFKTWDSVALKWV